MRAGGAITICVIGAISSTTKIAPIASPSGAPIEREVRPGEEDQFAAAVPACKSGPGLVAVRSVSRALSGFAAASAAAREIWRCLHVSPGLALWLCGASRAPSAASPQLPRPRARYFRAGQERVAPRTARPRAMPCSHVASVPCTCRDLHKRGPSAISAVDVAPMPSAARPARRGRFGSSVRDLRG